MLQCRFCLGVVEDVDDDGIVECECGAKFPVRESLFAPDHTDDIPHDDLDDDLTKFIRTPIRDANIQTEASNVLGTLAEKYPAVEEEKLGDVVEEFRQLLLKAFAEANKKNRDKKIRISLK